MAQNVLARSSAGLISRAADVPSSTALSAAMAVLQADGPSPTEAHVDTADTALIAYLAAAALHDTGQVILSYATTLTQNELKVAVASLMKQAEGIA